MQRPFSFQGWIDEHRHLLKPPVGNQQVFLDNEDFIVMVVGGPNGRKDYHYNEGEELFFQLEGDMTLKIINEEGKPEDIPIRAGEMFLLPPRVPHSPQRPAGTVGLVIERYRKPDEYDKLMWFCENCHEKLHEERFLLEDIVGQLKVAIENFFSQEELRRCKKCGTLMEKA